MEFELVPLSRLNKSWALLLRRFKIGEEKLGEEIKLRLLRELSC